MTTRILAFEGVDNFRDYGDYATAAGARIHPGRLYRSAHQARATDADLTAMAALNLAVIVDLRRPNERERDPSRRAPGFAGRVIDNDMGNVAEDPWHVFIRDSDLSAAAFRGYMIDYYRDAPHDARHIDLYGRYFQALAEGKGPVLIHCAAGKDRTGILAALTHHLIGVHDDDILADFMLTNTAARVEERIPLVTEMMAEQSGKRPAPDAVRVALGVDAAYLDRALKSIRAEHGSVDAYLEKALGVDAGTRERVGAWLVG
jgi:protein-tyrosine phosphatase